MVLLNKYENKFYASFTNKKNSISSMNITRRFPYDRPVNNISLL